MNKIQIQLVLDVAVAGLWFGYLCHDFSGRAWGWAVVDAIMAAYGLVAIFFDIKAFIEEPKSSGKNPRLTEFKRWKAFKDKEYAAGRNPYIEYDSCWMCGGTPSGPGDHHRTGCTEYRKDT